MLCLSTPHADCILPVRATEAPTSTLPQHAPRRMHLDVAPVSANASALPQHVLRGLHRGDRAVVSAIGIFASARPTRIASARDIVVNPMKRLCLSTSYADCIVISAAAARLLSAFASARPTRIASSSINALTGFNALCISTSYADCIRRDKHVFADLGLCISTSYADCIRQRLSTGTCF